MRRTADISQSRIIFYLETIGITKTLHFIFLNKEYFNVISTFQL